MEQQSETIDVFCYTCNVRVEARIVASHSEAEPTTRPAIGDETDVPYNVTVYNLGICNNCKGVFLVESTFCEIPGEVCAPQGDRVLYPSDRQFLLENVPQRVETPYLEASLSFKCGTYLACLSMCRKCIESLCYELGETKGTLSQQLSNLGKKGQISDKLLAWAHGVRLVGNEALHRGGPQKLDSYRVDLR